MKKNIMRAAAPVLALSLAASLFTGCGSSSTDETTTAASGTGATEESVSSESTGKDTLIIATANETPSMTTNLHNAVAGDYMNRMTHSNLFKVDENMNIVPDVVESYENLSDTEWQFKIYEGIKYHNGMTMTAEDVKASLELCAESPEVAQYSQSIASIDVIDDLTIICQRNGGKIQ